MNTQILLTFTLVAVVAICSANPVGNQQNNNGKYEVTVKNDGKYHAEDDGQYHANRHRNEGRNGGHYDAEGRYIHDVQPYRHVHDNRELGFYKHIPYPYDGGYGPYSGSNIPYIHDDRPYDHNLYTSTTTKKPTTTTKRTTTTTTTTTTTARPILFNYDDEGRHKILHQENVRKQDKYDHAFLTENGIYGEEQAKLHKDGGTHAKGYYEYTGDDGKLYRVNYQSDNKGFIPTGDHIHQIPDAIARALKWVEEKHKANGEMPMYDQRGFRIDRPEPKEIMAKIKAIHVEMMPKELSMKIMELQHEMEEEERHELEMEKQKAQEKKRTHEEKQRELEKQREMEKQKELERQRVLKKKNESEKQREVEKQKAAEQQQEVQRQRDAEKQKKVVEQQVHPKNIEVLKRNDDKKQIDEDKKNNEIIKHHEQIVHKHDLDKKNELENLKQTLLKELERLRELEKELLLEDNNTESVKENAQMQKKVQKEMDELH